jgi:hypothetical protein
VGRSSGRRDGIAVKSPPVKNCVPVVRVTNWQCWSDGRGAEEEAESNSGRERLTEELNCED